MEVRIGIQHAPRELVFEVKDSSAEDLETQVEKAVTDGGTLALTDSKGRRVLVPVGHIAYVEIGSGVAGTVGFR